MADSTIYVENFPLETRQDTLLEIFKTFGSIKNIKMATFDPEHPLNKAHKKNSHHIPVAKGYSFIEFHTKSGAEEACSYFNDLNRILATDEEDTPGKKGPEGDSRYRLLRVMSKKNFKDISVRYDEQRYQSLVKVAKRLLIS